jgi:hypothetical protein
MRCDCDTEYSIALQILRWLEVEPMILQLVCHLRVTKIRTDDSVYAELDSHECGD